MIIKETNYLALFAKSFNWAGFFLPKDTYEECSKLYAFCRVLDDVADANQDLKVKKERFNDLKEIFKEIETLKNNDLQSSTFEKDKVVISDMIIISEYKKIKDVVDKVNKSLSSIEQIRKFILIDHEFTIENNMMTPSMKVRRFKVKEMYGENLEKLY